MMSLKMSLETVLFPVEFNQKKKARHLTELYMINFHGAKYARGNSGGTSCFAERLYFEKLCALCGSSCGLSGRAIQYHNWVRFKSRLQLSKYLEYLVLKIGACTPWVVEWVFWKTCIHHLYHCSDTTYHMNLLKNCRVLTNICQIWWNWQENTIVFE